MILGLFKFFDFQLNFDAGGGRNFDQFTYYQKMSTILKMKGRHMYDIKYQSIFVHLNYKYNKDTSVEKWRYTTNKIMWAENKYFRLTLSWKKVK